MDWENWQEDYSGKTRLKDWWKMIKINLGIIKDNITGLKSDVDELPTKTELDKKVDIANTGFMGMSFGVDMDSNFTRPGYGEYYRQGDKYFKAPVITAVKFPTGNERTQYAFYRGTILCRELKILGDVSESGEWTEFVKMTTIGDLTALQTTEKNNIVSAVNELKTQINALHGFGADFWTGFFKTGRTDFSYAFINNGAAEIKPTQAINATVIKYMLLNCSELADASPIVVNLSANNPVVVGVCMGCSKMTKPPVINFTGENAHVCRSYVSAYANCAKLTQCTIWFGDGTQSASGERTDMANTFLNCSALTNLTFSGSGSPKSLDLSACKLLSNESIQSLYNALMDVSAVTSGTYKITINSDIQTKITALSLDFAAKGWTLEVKQEETSNA